MIENLDLDPLPDLPDELAELDRELAGIRVAERPSFGPELEAELARDWFERPRWAVGSGGVRVALAASVTALVFTGLVVPPARASLVTGLQRLLDVFQEPEAADVVAYEPAGSDPPGLGLVPVESEEAPERPAERTPRTEARSDGAPLEDFPSFARLESTYPTLADGRSEQRVMRRFYPPDLQRRGIGGTVGLLLWVDTTGMVDNVQMQRGSGVPALDRAALQAATSLHFEPATRGGEPVGTWVEFDLVFEPQPVEEPLPEVAPIADPVPSGGITFEIPDDWAGVSSVPAPIQLEAQELLHAALREPDDVVVERFGSLEGLLAGDPPAGTSPLTWRAEAATALERAMARDPDNPAPYLALARIRRKQGLREDARLLFERGVERSRRGTHSVSPRLVAELAYEHGRMVKQSWLAWRSLGRLPVDALDGRSCPRRAGPSGEVDTEILLAWNFVCPAALGGALEEAFEPMSGGEGEAERDAMLRSFAEAVDAYPAHVGANVEILLDLADQDLWMDLLNSARRFAWATQGHPYALLLSGLALQRLGRAEEALEDLERGFEVLGPDEAARFEDPTVLFASQAMSPEPASFWAGLDPVLNTDVNERRIEHLVRGTYAYLRFGGLDSDAARVWLRYGRPSTVRSFGASGIRIEFWDYGEGPDVTFTRPSGTEEFLLTSEAAAYLEDLRRVVPHWYGTRGRSLYSLPAQVARFRGEDGSVGMEVHLDVPEEFRLRASASDSLDLGIFLLGGSGERLSETRRRISARSTVVRLRDDAGPAVASVAVELYDSRGHRAARVRLPVRSDSESDPEGRLSDVMLVEPAAPMDRDLGRTDAWVTPLTRSDLLEGEQLGLLFELYDLPPNAEPYRVRVELVPASTGEAIPVEFRPSGQALFGSEWVRRPAGRGGRTVEYLTLDLGSVGPGEYTLRTMVELPGGEVVSEQRSGLLRRTAAGRADGVAGAGLERIVPD
jgi:protein TonB